jgi:arylsulfatase A-like enzyme
MGKWHLGESPPYRPQDRGFEESIYEPGGMITTLAEQWNNDVIDPVYQHNGRSEKYYGYRTDILFREAMEWMDECQKKEEPFFLYLSTFSPHGPHLVPKKYSKLYTGYKQANFFGMIANIDENMGRLEAFIREKGMKENTILIFMTDNGGTSGFELFNAGMRGRKGSSYEGGHRVPCFIRWPDGGIEGGRDIEKLTAHIDWFPTLVELCNINDEEKDQLEGYSLASLLKGKQIQVPDREIIVKFFNRKGQKASEYDPEAGKWDCAVLNNKWRLVMGDELYNIEIDPGQERNVAGEYPEMAQRLRESYEAFWQEVFPSTWDQWRPFRIGDSSEEIKITPYSGRAYKGDMVGFQMLQLPLAIDTT